MSTHQSRRAMTAGKGTSAELPGRHVRVVGLRRTAVGLSAIGAAQGGPLDLQLCYLTLVYVCLAGKSISAALPAFFSREKDRYPRRQKNK